jgi:lipid-binding SYLF domain-containing protein
MSSYDQQQPPPKKSTGKKIWDKGWAVTGKIIGEPSNKLVGKWGMESFWPTTTDKELDKAARILRVFTVDGGVPTSQNVPDPTGHKKQQRVLQRIPPTVIAKARGIAIFTVFRTGLHWSAASGSGILIARVPQGNIGGQTLEPGAWSAPSGILVHTLGVGFMIGIDIYDVVLILNTEKAVAAFAHPRVRLGAELAVAAGPVGDGRQIDADRAMSWSYTKSKGFFAGVQLDGTVIIERNDENERFYGQKLKAEEIISGRVARPQAAQGLYQTLAAAEGRNARFDMIPQGMGPSEEHHQIPQEVLQADGSYHSQMEAPHGYQDATHDTGYQSQPHPYAQQQNFGQQSSGYPPQHTGPYAQQETGVVGYAPPPQQQTYQQQQPTPQYATGYGPQQSYAPPQGPPGGQLPGAPGQYPPPPPRY